MSNLSAVTGILLVLLCPIAIHQGADGVAGAMVVLGAGLFALSFKL